MAQIKIIAHKTLLDVKVILRDGVEVGSFWFSREVTQRAGRVEVRHHGKLYAPGITLMHGEPVEDLGRFAWYADVVKYLKDKFSVEPVAALPSPDAKAEALISIERPAGAGSFTLTLWQQGEVFLQTSSLSPHPRAVTREEAAELAKLWIAGIAAGRDKVILARGGLLAALPSR